MRRPAPMFSLMIFKPKSLAPIPLVLTLLFAISCGGDPTPTPTHTPPYLRTRQSQPVPLNPQIRHSFPRLVQHLSSRDPGVALTYTHIPFFRDYSPPNGYRYTTSNVSHVSGGHRDSNTATYRQTRPDRPAHSDTHTGTRREPATGCPATLGV